MQNSGGAAVAPALTLMGWRLKPELLLLLGSAGCSMSPAETEQPASYKEGRHKRGTSGRRGKAVMGGVAGRGRQWGTSDKGCGVSCLPLSRRFPCHYSACGSGGRETFKRALPQLDSTRGKLKQMYTFSMSTVQ